MKILYLIAVCMLLASCATAYQPVGASGGFSETQYSESTFNISFNGNGFTSPQRAADFAMLRAADVALSHGYRYFAVISSGGFVENSSFTTPVTSTTSGFVSGNTFYANTNTYGGQTYNISKPSANLLIRCAYTNDNNNLLDAAFVSRSIRQKYAIRDEPSISKNTQNSSADLPKTEPANAQLNSDQFSVSDLSNSYTFPKRKSCLTRYMYVHGADEIKGQIQVGESASFLRSDEIVNWINGMNPEQFEVLSNECQQSSNLKPNLDASVSQYIKSRKSN